MLILSKVNSVVTNPRFESIKFRLKVQNMLDKMSRDTGLSIEETEQEYSIGKILFDKTTRRYFVTF